MAGVEAVAGQLAEPVRLEADNRPLCTADGPEDRTAAFDSGNSLEHAGLDTEAARCCG
jgi:hypothetical protein